AVGSRRKWESLLESLKGLKAEPLEVSVNSLSVSCDELRLGEQTINLTVDPERAAAFIAKAKATPGVTLAGWTSGIVEMDRAIRFAAAGWRDGDTVNPHNPPPPIPPLLTTTLPAT